MTKLNKFFIAALSAFFFLSVAVEAQEATPTIDKVELETFVDGIMAAHIQAHEFPGATLSIVKDGEVLLSKGYGFADLATREKVDGDRHLFRTGSVSKLFTWTAVMQLYEQGKLDLKANVNDYLGDYKVADAFGQPITMEHLLTHTPGFEDGGIGFLMVSGPEGIVNMEDFMFQHQPARIRAPGEISQYSNWGATLAGLIVEKLSGMTFDDYVDENIFKPLGMNQSTFREPLPANIEADMAKGYILKQGVFKEFPFEYIHNFGPAGSQSSSAGDMAKFMLMYLNGGEYNGVRLLKAETVETMMTLLHQHDESLPGFAHGFFQKDINGHRLIGHGGDTVLFHSDLGLLREEGLGIFVSYNAVGGAYARSELFRAIIERFYPVDYVALPDAPEDFAERGAKYAGNFKINRHNYTTTEKMYSFGGVVQVAPTADNYLMVASSAGVEKYVEIGPDQFRNLRKDHTVVFKANADGVIDQMYQSNLPMMGYYRVSAFESMNVQLMLVAFCLFFFYRAIKSVWVHRGVDADAHAGWRMARRLGALTSGVNLVFVAVFALVFASFNMDDLITTTPAGLGFALTIPYLSLILTFGVVGMCVNSWFKGYGTIAGRVHYTFVTIAAMTFLWILSLHNMMGYTPS